MNTKQLILATLATAAISLMSASAAVAQDASAAPAPIPAADAAWAEKKVVTTCQWCHGAQGHSISPIYPALAGQKAWYVIEQLQAFRARTRADPWARGIMWGMAAQLTDAQIAALADYFSKQTPFYSTLAPAFDVPKTAEIQEGKSIYNDGVAATGVPPCSACHQAAAEGSDQFPRLAGQHASYLTKQLIALHNGTREQIVMNGIAAPLTVPQMEAVSVYLESLH
ncbi:MAG: c-type cytochrome [Steroidobacteraceae bacterium]|jgi:cytochrome c553